LQQNGIRAAYKYARAQLILSKPIVLLAGKVLLQRDQSHQNIDYTNEKRVLFDQHKLLRGLYRNIILFDYFIQLFAKIEIPLALGKTIICDRYIYDTIITDFAVDMRSTNDQIVSSINRCFKILTKPDICFLIDVDETLALDRKTDHLNLDYLKNRRHLYLNIAKDFNMELLDGSRSQQDVFAQSVKILETEFDLHNKPTKG
jgi:thymidylate kinase